MSGQFGTCRSCGSNVLWVETEKGKQMPVDAEPDQRGNVVLVKMNGREVARYIGAWNADDYQSVPHFFSHFATCPHAGTWRKE